MRKIILLAMICTLISGCGLFRKKTTTVDRKQIDLIEQSQSNVSLTGKLESNKLVITQIDKTTGKEENTVIEADEINVDKDGNISAKGAKLTQNKKSNEQDNSRQQEIEQAKTDFSLKSDSSALKKISTDKLEKETKTEYNYNNILMVIAGISVCVLIIVFRKKISIFRF